jgi:uncharacterized Fe-S cluster protein YjdI
MSGHDETPWIVPERADGALIHQLMINLSLRCAGLAVKYSSFSEN